MTWLGSVGHAAGLDLGDVRAVDDDARHGRLGEDLAAELADLAAHRVPHLAGAVAGVVELVDQRLDLVALVAQERRLGGAEERQALDALGGPLGADLRRRDAPDLLVVGLEEERVQAPAEALGDPLLEVLLGRVALEQRGPQIGEAGARQLDRPELLDDVGAVERVVEELAVPEDARLARALEELVAHDLVPEVVDLLGLGEEAVAAEVEAVALGVDHGLGEAAELVLGLDDDHGLALLGEQVAGGQPRGAAAEHEHRVVMARSRARDAGSVARSVGSWRRRKRATRSSS